MNRDTDHLRLLSIFHYIYAGLIAVSSSLGVIYIGMGMVMMPMMAAELEAETARQRAAAKKAAETNSAEANDTDLQTEQSTSTGDQEDASGPPQPAIQPSRTAPPSPLPPKDMFSLMSTMMVVMGTSFLVIGFAFAFANVFAGRCIGLRKYRTFCLVTAGLNCINVPLGITLGVFTLIVLLRPSVEALFAGTIEASFAEPSEQSS